MSDYQIQPNKNKTLFYITYRTKRPEGGYKKNYLYNDLGQIVSFDNQEKADKYRKSLRANEDKKHNLKIIRERMAQKYGSHEDFLSSFLKEKKKTVPKSWERTEWHLLHYVFPFFIYEKKEHNTGLWATYFEEFKDWLEEAPTIRKNKLKGEKSYLSISSLNKIIGDLNGYLNHLYKKRHLLMPSPKCEYFNGAEEGYRSAEHIVEENEYKLVLEKFDSYIEEKELEKKKKVISLEKIDSLTTQIKQIQETKELYIVCRATGMRISEALGISFGDFYPKPLDDKNLNNILSKNGLKSHSYILLKSQLGEYDDKNEKWKREPLKTKKKISLDNSRTIPIVNGQEDCDKILKRLHVETRDYYKITRPGQITANEGQFLFFRNINKNIVSSYLRKVYNEIESKGHTWKSIHCLRHTRSTELVSQTHDQTLVKLVLGHKSRVFERYVHLEGTLAKKLTKDGLDSLLSFGDKKSKVI